MVGNTYFHLDVIHFYEPSRYSTMYVSGALNVPTKTEQQKNCSCQISSPRIFYLFRASHIATDRRQKFVGCAFWDWCVRRRCPSTVVVKFVCHINLEPDHLSRFFTTFSRKSQLEFTCARGVTFNPIWMQKFCAQQLASLIKSLCMPEVAPH